MLAPGALYYDFWGGTMEDNGLYNSQLRKQKEVGLRGLQFS